MESHRCVLCGKDDIEPLGQIQIDVESGNNVSSLSRFRIALGVDLCCECIVMILKRAVVQVQLEAVLSKDCS